MNIKKAANRERKRNKRVHGMQVDNTSIHLLEEQKRKRAIENRRKEKQKQLELVLDN
jgi:hypothetical protein